MALLGNRDGSDPSAHLRNMTRLFPFFFIAYHLRWVYIPKTHTSLQIYKKISSNFMWWGIKMQKYPYIKLYLSVSNIYIALSIKLRWPKWLTFRFHTTSQFRILNSEICTANFGIRNCEVYVVWANGSGQSTLESILNSETKTKGSTT